MGKSGKEIKICLVSSSGGHFEQLKMLKKLGEKYSIYIITENYGFDTGAKYSLIQSGKYKGHFKKAKDYLRFAHNGLLSLVYFLRERPDVIISTGTKSAIPTVFWGHLFRKKVIYIETFARVYDGTKAAKIVYSHHWYDLFLYQWEPLKDLYPDGVYGGGIY